jgi:hypothetical protein
MSVSEEKRKARAHENNEEQKTKKAKAYACNESGTI